MFIPFGYFLIVSDFVLLYAAPLEAIEPLSSTSVQNYLEMNLWNQPHNIVIAGTGIGHEEFVDMAHRNFGHMQPAPTQSTNNARSLESPYRGGEYRKSLETIDGMTRIGIALEIGGWSSDDLVPACVLQTLLGGGSSFSAGGPGKGMYSRLYRQILNRYYWADMAEAFTNFHTDSGLFGIRGRSKPSHTREAVRVFSEHLLRLAHDPVSDEELDRARNMLKNNVLTQLESRLVLFEDISRQILTYGKRESNAETTKKIDAVTKDDVQNLMKRALQKPPSVAAVGPDVSRVPSYTEVKSWFTSS
jgi:mitochondrial-processing peptidase subunit alpha